MTGYGIGQFALDGNVGMFNLAWLMVNTDSPPPARVYAQRDLPWLILHAEHLCPGDSKHTLLEMASLLTLPDFTDALTMTGPHIVQVSALLHNARKKLQSDEHHLRR